MEETVTFTLRFEWRSVELEPGVPYSFPQSIPAGTRPTLRFPAVYRWVIQQPGDEVIKVYIGESKDLRQRLHGYLSPGIDQQTNLRMNTLLNDEIARGCRVTIETMTFEQFRLNDEVIGQQDLGDQAVRRYLEQLMLVLIGRSGTAILNSGARQTALRKRRA